MTAPQKRLALRRRAFELRILAMRKGLTNRAIAKHLGVHEDLVSKAFLAQRFDALRRVTTFVRSYKPKTTT